MKIDIQHFRTGGLICAGVLFIGQGCSSVPGKSSATGTAIGGDGLVAAGAVGRLNVNIAPAGSSKEDRAVATRVGEALSSGLVAKGMRMAPEPGDIEIALRGDVREFDKTGNYYVYDGEIVSRISRTGDGKVVASRTFSDRGERGLGQQAALDAVSGQLADQVVPWTHESITSHSTGLGVEDITVTRVWYSGDKPEYSGLFTDTVSSLRGVISCTLSEENRAERSMTFRTVYIRDAFPEGLLNRVLSTPSLKLKAAK